MDMVDMVSEEESSKQLARGRGSGVTEEDQHLSDLQGPGQAEEKRKNQHLHGLQEKQCLQVKTRFQFEKTKSEQRSFVERVRYLWPSGQYRGCSWRGLQEEVRVVHAWKHMGWRKCGNLKICIYRRKLGSRIHCH